mgnify:CR=1 FL=1
MHADVREILERLTTARDAAQRMAIEATETTYIYRAQGAYQALDEAIRSIENPGTQRASTKRPFA